MYTLSCFADEISPKLSEQIEVMESLGLCYLSLRSVDNVNMLDLSDEQLETVARELKAHGMGVSSIGSPVGKTPITEDTGLHMRQLARAIHCAKVMGTRFIRIFSFYMEKDQKDLYREEVIRRLKEMTALAEENGIVLLHENEAGIYGESSARCRDLLASVGSANFRAAFDPCNFVFAGEEPFAQSLPNIREYAGYLHIKDVTRAGLQIVPAGEGDARIADALKTLDGNDLFVTLEPHLAVAGKMRGFTGAELFGTAHKALLKILEETGVSYK